MFRGPLSSEQADPVDITGLLGAPRTVAVIGCSPRASRTSHRIGRYLIREGFNMIPVHPEHQKILDRVCYPNVEAIPDDVQLDVVVIFRRPAETLAMVEGIARRAQRTGRYPVVWTQLGVSTDTARRAATRSGLPYVRNRCIMTEHSVRH